MKQIIKISTVLLFSLTVHVSVARQGDQAPPPPNGQMQGRGMELLRFDANQDGQITQEEVSAAHLQHFKELDADGNGFISESEFKQPPRGKQANGSRPPPPPPCEENDTDCSPPTPMKRQQNQQQHFKQLDTDGDGQVSQTEFMAKLPPFDRFDCDHNGIITQTELRNKSCQASQ